MAGRNQCLQGGVSGLKRRIAAAMVAMQVGIEQHVQRSALQCVSHQRLGLLCVCAVATINQCAVFASLNEHIVARQPATLKDLDSRRQGHGSNATLVGNGSRVCGHGDFCHTRKGDDRTCQKQLRYRKARSNVLEIGALGSDT